MGQIRSSKIIIVILCLLFTGFAIKRLETGETIHREKTTTLAKALTSFGAWHTNGEIPLDQKIVDELKLDDFVFRSFTNGTEVLSLYIGYYNSTKKVGAAHDPMVCYPGQGWVLDDIRKNMLPMNIVGEETELRYSTMIAERNGERELLVYWFQAHDQATADTLSQKIILLRSKVMGRGEDNAFVRVGISLRNKTEKEARDIVFSFVESFYPVFTQFVLSTEPKGE